jgi:outer membrane protein W
MKTRLGTAVLALAVCASAPAAHAGEMLFTVDGGWYDMTNASNSAKATFGESGGFAGGLAFEYGLSETMFLRAGGRYFAKSGERVFVDETTDEVFSLGHPVDVKVIPLYALFGYRFLEGARLRPYIAAGGGAALYDEESDVAGEIIEFSTTKPMGMAVVGADYGRGSIRFGIEAGYSIVPNTIGTGGVSEFYDEDDVGGFTAVGRISFAF